MLLTRIKKILDDAGRRWLIGGKLQPPTEDDIERVLDSAAVKLFNGVDGDRLEAGGLIIEKKAKGHIIYVMVGSYE